jgi:hypothetical protein
VKYHFEGEDKEIKHFVNLALAKPFLSGKARFNGENNLDFTEQLASIDLFGMELGYGIGVWNWGMEPDTFLILVLVFVENLGCTYTE